MIFKKWFWREKNTPECVPSLVQCDTTALCLTPCTGRRTTLDTLPIFYLGETGASTASSRLIIHHWVACVCAHGASWTPRAPCGCSATRGELAGRQAPAARLNGHLERAPLGVRHAGEGGHALARAVHPRARPYTHAARVDRHVRGAGCAGFNWASVFWGQSRRCWAAEGVILRCWWPRLRVGALAGAVDRLVKVVHAGEDDEGILSAEF